MSASDPKASLCAKLMFSSSTLQEEEQEVEEVSHCSFVRLSDEVRPGAVCPVKRPDLKSAWLDLTQPSTQPAVCSLILYNLGSPFGFYPDFVSPFSCNL